MDVYVVVGWGNNKQAVEVFTDDVVAEKYLDLLIESGLQGSYSRRRAVDGVLEAVMSLTKGNSDV